MKTNLNDWLQHNYNINTYGCQETREHITCCDGTTLSVQASEGHYCTPRVSYVDHEGNVSLVDYLDVEVWCVSSNVPESWLEYGDQETNPYGYTPIGMVEEFIDLHGGIKE